MTLARLTAATTILLLTLAAASRASGKRVSVVIDDLKCSPSAVEVDVGDVIVWTNNDDRAHTVKADDGAFDSGPLRPGRTFTWTATKPGRHAYGSDPFPRTRGVVVVREKK